MTTQNFTNYEFHYTDQCSGKRFDKLVFLFFTGSLNLLLIFCVLPIISNVP